MKRRCALCYLAIAGALALVGICPSASADLQDEFAAHVEQIRGARSGAHGGDVLVSSEPLAENDDGKNETGCASLATCSACDSTRGCHWCSWDDACHAIGSIHGCAWGATCKANNDTEKQDQSCSAHTTCSECALSSWGCHWCAHDNACHAVGSIHGCISGVDCYSNDRCMRKEPEPIRRYVYADAGLVPLLGIAAAGLLVCCCASLCLGGVWCMKGMRDDLSILAGPYNGEAESLYVPPSVMDSEENADNGGEEAAEDGDEGVDAESDADANTADDTSVRQTEAHQVEPVISDSDDLAPLIVEEQTPNHADIPYAIPKNIDGIYKGCKICYAITIAVTFIFAIFASIMFPKYPEYNVCNNQMAWKSVVDGMASGKMEASFQLLMSVMNPNHMSVIIDMGTGNFRHNDAYVGNFEIPTATIAAMSTTDILVSCSFSPDKWHALDLAAEYHRGTLKFNVDAEVAVKIPALGGYTFEGGIENYVVNTNDPNLEDRHLCACPTWKDEKKHDAPDSEVSRFLLANN